MNLLRWIGGIVILVWILGLIFRVGGSFIHILLLIAAAAFLYDKFVK